MVKIQVYQKMTKKETSTLPVGGKKERKKREKGNKRAETARKIALKVNGQRGREVRLGVSEG
jgi:hypothetical protein